MRFKQITKQRNATMQCTNRQKLIMVCLKLYM